MHASIVQVVSVAKAIGALADEVVFVGAAITPLLHTERVLAGVRPTRDVDGIVASASYHDVEKLAQRLRASGFTHIISSAEHMHRWKSPAQIFFDLVPAGKHPGGSGGDWDSFALQSPVVVTIEGVALRHVSAAVFVAMKLDAYADRGEGDVHASHDIEDVIALLASRPSIVADVRAAHPQVMQRIASFAATLVDSEIVEDILASHLNNADDVAYTVGVTRDRLHALAKP